MGHEPRQTHGEAHIAFIREQVGNLNTSVGLLQRQVLAATNVLTGQQTAINELQNTIFAVSQQVRDLADRFDQFVAAAAVPKEEV